MYVELHRLVLLSLVSIVVTTLVSTTQRRVVRLHHRNQVLNDALSRLTSAEPYPVDVGIASSLSATSNVSAGGEVGGFPAIPRLADRGRELAASLRGECLCRNYLAYRRVL